MTDQPIVFADPTEPEAAPILALHRGHDGFVTFHDRDELGRFRDLYAIKAADLSEGLFREHIARDLGKDSYYSVNGFYRPSRSRSTINPAYFKPARSSDTLRWLTACYCDLDCYKLGISVGQAVGALIDMQDSGVLPPASMMTRSGRGVWAMWFLRDAQGGQGPQRATWFPTQSYHRVQRRLGQITAALGHDAQARDTARVTRVPGSLHGTAGVRVQYWLQADEHGQPFTYSIEELCALLNVAPAIRTTPTLGKVVDPEKSERARSGWRALWAKRLRAFLQLAAIRNGFDEGMRNRAAWLYAGIMYRARVDDDEIRLHVRGLASRCRPALSTEEAEGAYKARRKLRSITDQTISDWLDITPAESHTLGDKLPPASRFVPYAEPVDLSPKTRAQRQEQRRGALVSIIGRGRTPTVRELQDKLAELGIDAALGTITADLRAIGKASTRASKAKPSHPTLIDVDTQ